MEKFGEWKRIVHGHDFGPDADLSWEVDVLVPGEYQVSLNYAGEGRLVWHVGIDGGESIQNQQIRIPDPIGGDSGSKHPEASGV